MFPQALPTNLTDNLNASPIKKLSKLEFLLKTFSLKEFRDFKAAEETGSSQDFEKLKYKIIKRYFGIDQPGMTNQQKAIRVINFGIISGCMIAFIYLIFKHILCLNEE